MELGEHLRKFLLCVDQMMNDLERVDRPVDPKDIKILILSGLTPQYDAEVRMLESSYDWPKREWIEHAVINKYERRESEKSAAGSRDVVRPRPPPQRYTPHPMPPLLPCRSLCLENSVNSRSPAVRRNRTHIRGMENKTATAQEAENGGGGGNGRGGKSGVSTPTLGLGCSSPQALARLWPHAAPCASGMKMSTGW